MKKELIPRGGKVMALKVLTLRRTNGFSFKTAGLIPLCEITSSTTSFVRLSMSLSAICRNKLRRQTAKHQM